MDELLRKICEIFAAEGYNDLYGAVEEKQLMYLYALYHYYYGDSEDAFYVNERSDYNASSQNFMQGFFDNESYDKKCLDILVPYYVAENEDFDLSQVKYRINQVQNKVAQMKHHYFENEKSKIIDYWDPQSKDRLNIKVLTNYVPDFDRKNEIISIIEKIEFLENGLSSEIVFGDDIVDEITQTVSDKKCVEESVLELQGENNFLTYGNEKSLITNISAKSLKENYKRYSKAGLLAMNLRFYVSNKKVDEDITKSIRKCGNEFWYLNNGIIIVCEDYEIIDGKYLKLKNFSIVNGGQTTHLIGTIPFDDDFAISCKVIKQKYNNEDENVEFIARVAEASNSQKPIKSTDIIANKIEQRKLKSRLASAGIFMQVKRGEAALGELKQQYPEAWQRTKNDELAQLLYSGIYQKPGTARNSKNSLFTNFSKYNEIFEPEYDTDLIGDVLKIRTAYKNWAKNASFDEDKDLMTMGLIKNGLYFTIAALCLSIKLKLSNKLVTEIKNVDILSDASVTMLSSRTFNHKIFKGSYNNLEPILFKLFDLIMSRFIRRPFKKLKDARQDIVYSNFMKTDKNYLTYVVPEIFDSFTFSESNELTELLNQILHVEDSFEQADSTSLVDIAIADSKSDKSKSNKLSLNDEKLKTKLIEYKQNIKELTGKTPFTITEAGDLARQKPTERNDLYGIFKKRPKTKVRLYGKEILEIIKTFIEENK